MDGVVRPRKRGGSRLRVVVFASLVLGLLGGNLSPAAAATGFYSGVRGSQVHTGTPYQPSPPCGHYESVAGNPAYRGVLGAPPPATALSVAGTTYSGPLQMTITSAAGKRWDENPYGSYTYWTGGTGGGCAGSPGGQDVIPDSFGVVVEGNQPASAGATTRKRLTCTGGNTGDYIRDPDPAAPNPPVGDKGGTRQRFRFQGYTCQVQTLNAITGAPIGTPASETNVSFLVTAIIGGCEKPITPAFCGVTNGSVQFPAPTTFP